MTVIWLSAIGLLILIELLTYGLYFAALAVAALVPLVLSLLGLEIWVQGLGFLGAAILSLVYVRPLIKRLQGDKPEAITNSAALVGKSGLAVEDISAHKGLVKVNGEEWSALSNAPIPAGSIVIVEEVSGASLIVRKDV
jgi:membrane protein implicated in regulation of membrane protease activity